MSRHRYGKLKNPRRARAILVVVVAAIMVALAVTLLGSAPPLLPVVGGY